MLRTRISDEVATFLQDAFGEEAVVDLDDPRLDELGPQSMLGPSWQRNSNEPGVLRFDLRTQRNGISFQSVLVDRQGNLELRNCLPRQGGLLYQESLRLGSDGDRARFRHISGS